MVFLLTTKQINLSLGLHFLDSLSLLILHFELVWLKWGLLWACWLPFIFLEVAYGGRKCHFQSLWEEVYASFTIWDSRHCHYSLQLWLFTFLDMRHRGKLTKAMGPRHWKNAHKISKTTSAVSLSQAWSLSVTTEPARNGPVLFNEILSCFSEATDQDLMSCTRASAEET